MLYAFISNQKNINNFVEYYCNELLGCEVDIIEKTLKNIEKEAVGGNYLNISSINNDDKYQSLSIEVSYHLKWYRHDEAISTGYPRNNTGHISDVRNHALSVADNVVNGRYEIINSDINSAIKSYPLRQSHPGVVQDDNYIGYSECQSCSTKGVVDCPNCNDGKVSCHRCHGSGGHTCDSCFGRGVFNSASGPVSCGCYLGRQNCLSCSSTGKIQCFTCLGNGTLGCRNCKSKGYFTHSLRYSYNIEAIQKASFIGDSYNWAQRFISESYKKNIDYINELTDTAGFSFNFGGGSLISSSRTIGRIFFVQSDFFIEDKKYVAKFVGPNIEPVDLNGFCDSSFLKINISKANYSLFSYDLSRLINSNIGAWALSQHFKENDPCWSLNVNAVSSRGAEKAISLISEYAAELDNSIKKLSLKNFMIAFFSTLSLLSAVIFMLGFFSFGIVVDHDFKSIASKLFNFDFLGLIVGVGLSKYLIFCGFIFITTWLVRFLVMPSQNSTFQSFIKTSFFCSILLVIFSFRYKFEGEFVSYKSIIFDILLVSIFIAFFLSKKLNEPKVKDALREIYNKKFSRMVGY